MSKKEAKTVINPTHALKNYVLLRAKFLSQSNNEKIHMRKFLN